MNIRKKIISGVMAVAVLSSIAVPTFAAPGEGTTNVYYTSENVIVGPNGAKWGVKIPSGVYLTNAVTETAEDAAHGLQLVSVVDKPINEVYQSLTVTAKVKSENGFKFKKNQAADIKGAYSYKIGQDTLNTNTGKIEKTLTDKLTVNSATINGKFKLEEVIKEEGKYSDTLTFKFAEEGQTVFK